MYPQKNPVITVKSNDGKTYIVHKGKLSPHDSREAWVEGPDLNGRMCPIGSYWDVSNAIAAAKEMAKAE